MSALPTLGTTYRPLLGRRAAQVALVMAVVLSSLVGGWGAAPAEATSYRFWSYWTGGSDWTFSNQGASRRPVDGGVEGWRFAISPASSSTIPPRHSPSFASLCGNTPAEDGKKRVGLVVDYGTSSDAPDGESPPSMLATCAVVPEDANGYDVLVTVAQLRTDSGLICGINGYPASECGAPASDPTPDPTSGSDQSSGGNGDGGSGSGNGSGGDGGGTNGPESGSSATTPGNDDAGKKGDPKGKKNDDGKKSDADKPSPSASAVSDATPAAAAIDGSTAAPSSGSPIGLIVGLIVVIALGVTAIVLRRRKA
jgi:hypothetical protein